MQYKITGIIKHEETVDVNSPQYQDWLQSSDGQWAIKFGKHMYGKNLMKINEYVIQQYIEHLLSYQIYDDNGHCTLSTGSYDWTVEKIRGGD